jgi:hypothetical protein
MLAWAIEEINQNQLRSTVPHFLVAPQHMTHFGGQA